MMSLIIKFRAPFASARESIEWEADADAGALGHIIGGQFIDDGGEASFVDGDFAAELDRVWADELIAGHQHVFALLDGRADRLTIDAIEQGQDDVLLIVRDGTGFRFSISRLDKPRRDGVVGGEFFTT